MGDPATQEIRWTTADLALVPDDGKRYELIDGVICMSKQPHWHHQDTCFNICRALNVWSEGSGLGRALIAPGLIFGDYDNVVPDVAWVTSDKLASLIDEAGHLTGAPDLAVEVLSPGPENARRDRELKRKLYSVRGVREYWIVDWVGRTMEVYRRHDAQLVQVATLLADEAVTSPILPGFECSLARFFT